MTAMVGLLNAPTGTRLYKRMREEGRLIDCISGDNGDGATNILPRMGLDVLREGYGNLMQYIYSPKHYYKRSLAPTKVKEVITTLFTPLMEGKGLPYYSWTISIIFEKCSTRK